MSEKPRYLGAIRLSRKLTLAEAKMLLDIYEDVLDTHDERILPPIPKGLRDSSLQWVPSESMDGIVWDRSDGFRQPAVWLGWVCQWLGDREIVADGAFQFFCESVIDDGVVLVKQNEITYAKFDTANDERHEPLSMNKLAMMCLDRVEYS